MITDHNGFILHTDINWEKIYKADQDYSNKESIKFTLTFKNKNYHLFQKHVILSDFLYDFCDSNANLILNLKYCDKPAAFDLFMQMLYGKYPLQIPHYYACELITTCIELG